MARTARCTSCGAPVTFKSVASVLAVCDYCQSTLVQDSKALADLGKMAALIPDRSPLQRGAEGRWRGLHFALIGRLQLQWEQGLWNEWHLLFDDGSGGWLSEAGGEYVISVPKRLTVAVPEFATLQAGQTLTLLDRPFTVTNVLTATCVAGEGELPFKVGAGYPAPVVDLRDADGGFATLDYSDGRPLLFVGESIEFADLKWNGLRDPTALPTIDIQARAFNCPSCAAALEITHPGIQTVGCTSCGAVLDTTNPTVKLLAEVPANLLGMPRIALGSRGTLRNVALEVIGFMQRSGASNDDSWTWQEYVLLGPAGRTYWLTEYDGHWNFGETLKRSLRPAGTVVVLDKQRYEHFQSCVASVEYVLGEFPWRVTLGETVEAADYIAPPRLVSRENNLQEETWSLLEYVEPQEIATAFGLTEPLPTPIGIYANQVNPHQETHARVCAHFWKFALVGTLIHLALLFWMSAGEVHRETLAYDGSEDEPQLTGEFRLSRPVGRLDISHDTDISNNWIGLGLTLINKDTGQTWQASREIALYEGVEDGEAWVEGSRGDAVTFTGLPAGTYVLAEEAELGGTAPTLAELLARAPTFYGQPKAPPRPAAKPVHATVKITRAGPRWSSYFLLLGGLILFPIYTRTRRYSFESKRWAQSDHPHIYASNDETTVSSGHSSGAQSIDYDSSGDFSGSDGGSD